MVFGWGKSIGSFNYYLPRFTSPPDRFFINFQGQLLIIFITGESQDAYNQVQSDDFQPNESSFGHEALAGAASFGAFKVFEDRQRADGTFMEAPS